MAPPAPFIVGAPRSGTTLLRLMLDSHSALAIPPETHFIPRVAAAWRRRPANPVGAVVRVLAAHPNWPDLGLDLDEVATALRTSRPADAGAALRMIYRAYAARQGKPRWGDKTPRYSDEMELIRELLPEARFVHIVRDGRDVALSLRRVWFGPDDIAEAARYWSGRVERARTAGAAVGGYFELRYEDLVAEPEAELRRVCALCELEWEPDMLEYPRRAEERLAEEERDLPAGDGVITAEQRRALHVRARNPPDPSSIGRWRREMTAPERREFEAIAGDSLRALGYGLEA